jgi:hypothetical protein
LAYVPVTVTVSPGVTVLELSDSERGPVVLGGTVVVVGPLGSPDVLSKMVWRATTNAALCNTGTRKQPVTSPLKDWCRKPLFVEHRELCSSDAGMMVVLE